MTFLISVGLWMLRNWRLVLNGIAVAVIIGCIVYVKNLQHAADVAKAHLAAETMVAEKNRAAAEYLVAHQKQMEGLRATVTANATKRATAVTTVIEGITHEPTLRAPAGPGFDALGDSLRKLEADTHG